jgi:hypothetical protein
MIDMRVAKYSAIANMRALETADQMAREVIAIADRQPRHR